MSDFTLSVGIASGFGAISCNFVAAQVGGLIEKPQFEHPGAHSRALKGAAGNAVFVQMALGTVVYDRITPSNPRGL